MFKKTVIKYLSMGKLQNKNDLNNNFHWGYQNCHRYIEEYYKEYGIKFNLNGDYIIIIEFILKCISKSDGLRTRVINNETYVQVNNQLIWDNVIMYRFKKTKSKSTLQEHMRVVNATGLFDIKRYGNERYFAKSSKLSRIIDKLEPPPSAINYLKKYDMNLWRKLKNEWHPKLGEDIFNRLVVQVDAKYLQSGEKYNIRLIHERLVNLFKYHFANN